MPLYDALCEKCGATVGYLRSMAESDSLPRAEEESTAKPGTKKLCKKKHKWKKVMLGAPSKRYAPGWGSDRKGSYGSSW